MNQDAAEVEDVLDWVHGHSGPGTDVDVFVMEIVCCFVEWWPMQEPVDPVEVEQPPQLDGAEHDDEVDGMFST